MSFQMCSPFYASSKPQLRAALSGVDSNDVESSQIILLYGVAGLPPGTQSDRMHLPL